MIAPTITIQPTTPEILEKILPLIAEYQEFYKQTPNTDRNRAFFSQFIGEDKPVPSRLGIQFAALDTLGNAVGFATVYFLPSSLTGGWYCVMNDLLVVKSARRFGVGQTLIHRCQEYARAKDFSAIYWMTQEENETAQRLYDHIGAKSSRWLYYALPTVPGSEPQLA